MKKTTLLYASLLLIPYSLISQEHNPFSPAVSDTILSPSHLITPQEHNPLNQENFPSLTQSPKQVTFEENKKIKVIKRNGNKQKIKKVTISNREPLPPIITQEINTVLQEEQPIESIIDTDVFPQDVILKPIKTQETRSTASTFFHTLLGSTWSELFEKDWLNGEGLLAEEWHQRAKNEYVKSVDEKIKLVEKSNKKVTIKDHIPAYRTCAYDIESDTAFNYIISLLCNLHENQNPTDKIGEYAIKSEQRGFKNEDTTSIQRAHQMLIGQKDRLKLLGVLMFSLITKRLQKMNTTANNLVSSVPKETSEEIKLKNPSFSVDPSDYNVKQILLHCMFKEASLKKAIEEEERKKMELEKQKQEENNNQKK